MKNVQFEKDILLVPKLYDTLKIVSNDGEYFIKGSLDIIDDSGKLWDTYQVEIKGSEDYPFTFRNCMKLAMHFLKMLTGTFTKVIFLVV